MNNWGQWFAWRPVRIERRWVWLKRVERTWGFFCCEGVQRTKGAWRYRRLL